MTEDNSNNAAPGDADGDQEELTADAGLSTRQEFQMRFALAQALGENIPSDEDYYDVFSWDKNPSVEDFYALALRNPYAYAVTFLESDTVWRDAPDIVDKGASEDDTQTAFERRVEEIVDEHRVNHYLHRARRLAGIGKFGCLVIQFDDVDDPHELRQPVGDASEITGLKPFSRMSITDVRVGGPGSGRWGEPIAYQLDFSDENETEGVIEHEGPDTVWVHWERVIHIPSDELLDDEIRGIPRQKPCYNQLIDIERTLGAAGILAYRAAAWGIHINIDGDFDLQEERREKLNEHLQAWRWGLEDVLKTHGADEVKSLGGENIDPRPIIDANIEAISAQTGIPQSLLKGNETGERATTEDVKQWYGSVGETREEFDTPLIVREFWDRLIRFGIVPEPAGDGYDVDWTPLFEMSQQDEAAVQETRSQTIQNLPDLERELDAAEQATFLEDGTLPNDLDERLAQRDRVQDEMGPLDDETEAGSGADD